MIRKRNRQEKQFNPWPSFVDMFSSVILVLLFFILFMIVLLAYYLQFNSITKISKVVNDEIKTNTINVKTEVINTKIVMVKKEERPRLRKKLVIKDGEKDGAATKNELKTDFVGMNLKKAKKDKLINEIELSKIPNMFILPFKETEEIIDNKKYKKMLKEFSLRKGFEKVTIISFLPKNTMLNLVQKNKLSLVRTVNIKNFISNTKIDLNKVEFKFKRNNYDVKYKEYEKDGYFIFLFE